ncbi:MAG: L-2-hydroxyglutarate oxidase [Acidobacteria bacterium]|nr:MAG: L-2-hydroxyglutarate oxidase [Acidobacteriota bacterium]
MSRAWERRRLVCIRSNGRRPAGPGTIERYGGAKPEACACSGRQDACAPCAMVYFDHKMNYDFVIVGGGIVGLALARELRQRFPAQTIALFEKEGGVGKHASGRNSGVLHSGIYYSPGSLKAKVSVEGRRLMTEYCEQNHLPLSRIGKVILPVRETDDAQLDLLLSRAQSNGVRAELVDQKALTEIEPEAKSCTGKALWVPDACIVESKIILAKIAEDLKSNRVDLRFGAKVESVDSKNSNLRVGPDTIHFGHLFNAAGAYADIVAKAFDIGKRFTILPFKGIYYRLSPDSGLDIRHLIYAVPDLRVPFLGVHFMKTIGGEIYLGPTVIPAFGRENYTWLQGLSLFDTGSILYRIAEQYVHNRQGFRLLLHKEGRRFLRKYFAQAAQALVPAIRPKLLMTSNKVGIRAQLLDTEKKELVMDFVVERSANSTHILNAVSPAFTSSFAFASMVLDEVSPQRYEGTKL